MRFYFKRKRCEHAFISLCAYYYNVVRKKKKMTGRQCTTFEREKMRTINNVKNGMKQSFSHRGNFWCSYFIPSHKLYTRNHCRDARYIARRAVTGYYNHKWYTLLISSPAVYSRCIFVRISVVAVTTDSRTESTHNPITTSVSPLWYYNTMLWNRLNVRW